ncbi:hypothetical protein HYPSUDRAFT_1091502 [Hypholoma sublateritium FD-334 SS-4]|uniref:Uncharacterized protein n=1 Tax=Hypholoma sublateritium (strain FD-334 SS-4) TaxID=945553 RepID=A0A0D2PHP3_HYPSF|nr:hypothetical protein HYPSUDRAFT_1091502 [Hypholoma sublateritium FD-334 SS-4]
MIANPKIREQTDTPRSEGIPIKLILYALPYAHADKFTLDGQKLSRVPIPMAGGKKADRKSTALPGHLILAEDADAPAEVNIERWCGSCATAQTSVGARRVRRKHHEVAGAPIPPLLFSSSPSKNKNDHIKKSSVSSKTEIGFFTTTNAPDFDTPTPQHGKSFKALTHTAENTLKPDNTEIFNVTAEIGTRICMSAHSALFLGCPSPASVAQHTA